MARAGNLDEAAAIFEALLVEQPGIAEVHRNLGYIHAQRKDWAKAEESYQAALDLRPGDTEFVTALAQLYQDSGQDDKAVALMAQAAADDPENAETQLNQGIFQLNQGQTTEAQASFEAALAADPSLAEAHYHLGTILVGQGKVTEAVEHLETYIASNPDERAVRGHGPGAGAGTEAVIADRVAAVRERIARAAERASRPPDGVTLVAVSKTFPAAGGARRLRGRGPLLRREPGPGGRGEDRAPSPGCGTRGSSGTSWGTSSRTRPARPRVSST